MKKITALLVVILIAFFSGVSAQTNPSNMDSLFVFSSPGVNHQTDVNVSVTSTGTFSSDYLIAWVVRPNHIDTIKSSPYFVVPGDSIVAPFVGLSPNTLYSYGAYAVFSAKKSQVKIFTTGSCSFAATVGHTQLSPCVDSLYASPTGTQYTYQWKANGVGIPGATLPYYKATNSGNYNVVVADSNCSQVSPVQSVSVSSLTVTISANVASISCGNSVTLTASGADTYVWQPDNFTVGTITVSPEQNTTYVVTGTMNGCTGTASKAISVIPLTVSISGESSLCKGSSVTLTASGADTYSWQPGNKTGASITVSPSATTSYTVVGTSNSCTGTAVKSIIVNTGPGNVSIEASKKNPCTESFDPVILTGIPSGGIFSGEHVEDNQFLPTGANLGIYYSYYTCTSVNGCSTVDSVRIKVVGPPTISSIRYDASNDLLVVTGAWGTEIEVRNLRSDSIYTADHQTPSDVKFRMNHGLRNNDWLSFMFMEDPSSCFTDMVYTTLGIQEESPDFVIKKNEEVHIINMSGVDFSIKAPSDFIIYEAQKLFNNLSPGIYVLYIIRDSHVFTRKIIIGQ